MRKPFVHSIVVGLLLLLWAVGAQGANGPGQFYLTNSANYWLYSLSEPGFSLQVPAKGEAYVQNDLFGTELLSISMGTEGPVYLICATKVQSAKDVEALSKSALGWWTSQLAKSHVTADESITTTKGLSAQFYEVQGTLPSGKTGIAKWVGFQKSGTLVGLVLITNADDYKGDLRAYWLQMVNTFAWK